MLKKYSIIVEGSNIYLRDDEGVGRFGLYTTRWIEAENENEAKKTAVDLVVDEINSLEVLKNLPTDPPAFLVDEVREVDSFDGFKVPGKGFTFFPEPLEGH